MEEPSINLISVLLLLGAGQGLFLALVLARMKSGNRIANRCLALLLLVFSVGLIEGFLAVTYYYLRYPSLIGLQWPLMFAYGPLAYFYVKSLTSPHRWKQRWKTLIHFLPVILLYIYLVPLFLLNAESKAWLWYLQNSRIRSDSAVIEPLQFVVIIQISGYLILSLRLLAIHEKNIRQNYSALDEIGLSWLRSLLVVFGFLLCTYTFFAVFSQFHGVNEQVIYLNNLIVAMAIYVMGYKGIRQAEIFTALLSLETAKTDDTAAPAEMIILQQATTDTEEAGKYAKSSLNAQQADAMLARLTELMEKKKPYLEMGLTLPMLSRMLDAYPHHLSQVINGKAGKNFFDFVNEYRVQEAKKVLSSSASGRFSILGIAMDAGFNSKNAFYAAFKKSTGMTPSQFRKNQNRGEQNFSEF